MTEALPVADISLSGLEAAGPGDGVCVGLPVEGVSVAVSPLAADGSSEADPVTTAGLTGEICVRAAHVKDRYDRLWATERASARDHRLAPHRRRRAPRRPTGGCGWRAGWSTS